MIPVWQVDINKKYWVDEDENIFENQEDFYDYHIEECNCIKDYYEQWCADIEEHYGLKEKEGIDITHDIYNDMQDTIEWYRNHDRNK